MRLHLSISSHPTHGFTLPEVTVVVMLIALLSSHALPAIAKGWESVMYARIGNTLLLVINGVRQHAITNEQDTLIEFKGNRWCARLADADEHSCDLGVGHLPGSFKFYPVTGSRGEFLYTAGRGFSPLSSASIKVGNYNTHAAKAMLSIVNSSVGRVRICTTVRMADLPAC